MMVSSINLIHIIDRLDDFERALGKKIEQSFNETLLKNLEDQLRSLWNRQEWSLAPQDISTSSSSEVYDIAWLRE